MKTDYTYNIRGWLTKINDLPDGTQQLFEMDLAYNDSPNPQFNGNIGSTSWKNPYESMVNHYDYTYDEMNRLTSALYDDGGASTMDFDVPQVNYELNGNIETLHRYGNHGDTANLKIDELIYTYAIGNQLSKVSDDSDRDSGFKDGTDQTTEYLYDANGNMVEDRNKGITSIEYNHLNLPKKVTFSPSKYIEYTYDASGAKLAQKLVDGGSTIVTDYIADFVYEDDKLQFLQHAEGRVVVLRDENGNINDVEYQYHLKDHLGNVRATFKTEEETDAYQATFEDDAETKSYESTYFSRYGEVTRINADIFDHTDAGTSNTYSSRLNGTGNEVYGLAKSLEVKPGDKVSAEVWAKYLDPSTTGASGSAFAQLIEDLTNNAPSVVVDGATAGSDPMPFAGLIGYGGDVSSGPKAYLNIIVFDLNYQVVNTAYTPVTAAAEEDGTDVSHQYLNIAPVTIEEPGYVYIYLSNESQTPVEVFFDDFGVTHTNTDIVQKDDYYPFGLSFNSYSRPSSTPQAFKFNGKERDEITGWDDFGARMYMPELGRWNHIDPAGDEYFYVSPYTYALNTPINAIDPDGKRVFFVAGAGNDQIGWNYVNRWGRAFEQSGISGFTRLNVSHDDPVAVRNGAKPIGDMMFSSSFRSSRYDRFLSSTSGMVQSVRKQDKMINKAISTIQSNLADNPLSEGEQLNLAGYSYGSVLQAHAALGLADQGQKIDNLILIGSPISSDSELYGELTNNENIGNVIRVDIDGDLFSNPEGIDFVRGVLQNLGIDGAHFDLARPGEEANKRIREEADKLRKQGVY